MGMFDTIIFDRPIPCPKCGAEIRSDQTKAFECTLDDYRIGDCVAHAEEIRIVRDELFCGKCTEFTGAYYYLAVYRGILVGIDNSTCYDLGLEHAAYRGEFENQTNLKLDLLEKVVRQVGPVREGPI